jgi:hypothetical protein
MPGRIVRRVAKGALGMWTEVYFPNGDRVMVSMARDSIQVWKISRWGALFGRKTLAFVGVTALAAWLEASTTPVHDEPAGSDLPTTEQAWKMVFRRVGPVDILDAITTSVCAANSAEEVRGTNLPDLVLAAWAHPNF